MRYVIKRRKVSDSLLSKASSDTYGSVILSTEDELIKGTGSGVPLSSLVNKEIKRQISLLNSTGTGSTGTTGNIGTRIEQKDDVICNDISAKNTELKLPLESLSLYKFEFNIIHSALSSSFPIEFKLGIPTNSTIIGQILNERTSVSGEIHSFTRIEDIRITAVSNSNKDMVTKIEGWIKTANVGGFIDLKIGSKQENQTSILKNKSSLIIWKQ